MYTMRLCFFAVLISLSLFARIILEIIPEIYEKTRNLEHDACIYDLF